MAYRLSLADVRGGLLAVAESELERLRAIGQGQDDAALEMRKSLKRIRSLFALARTRRNARGLQRLDRALRDRGRALAQSRLQSALHQTHNALVARGAVVPARLGKAMHRSLVPLERVDVDIQIEALPALMDDLSLKGISVDSIVANAAAAYRQARYTFRTARADDTSDALHEWRKQVQQHTRHMQLLRDLWPDEMVVRIAAGKSLARMLGEEHDLHEFDLWLDTLGGPKSDRRRLARVIAERQTALRGDAHALGLRLFAERPKAFRRRLSAYAC